MDEEVQQSLQDLQRQFLEVDHDYTGTLPSTDFVFVLLRNGSSREQAAALLEEFVEPHSPGKVNYQTMLRHLSRVAAASPAFPEKHKHDVQGNDHNGYNDYDTVFAIPERKLFSPSTTATAARSASASLGPSAASRSASLLMGKRRSSSSSSRSSHHHKWDGDYIGAAGSGYSGPPMEETARSLSYMSPIPSQKSQHQSPLSPSPRFQCPPTTQSGGSPSSSKRNAAASQSRQRKGVPSLAFITEALHAARASAAAAASRSKSSKNSTLSVHPYDSGAEERSNLGRNSAAERGCPNGVSTRHSGSGSNSGNRCLVRQRSPSQEMEQDSPLPRNPAASSSSSPPPPGERATRLGTATELLDNDEVVEREAHAVPLRPPPPPPTAAHFSLKSVFSALRPSPDARVVPLSAVCEAFQQRRRHLDVSTEELEALADALDLDTAADGDPQLTLADFCLLISRLRPSQIQRVRQANAWQPAERRHLEEGRGKWEEEEEKPRGSAAMGSRVTPAHRCRTSPPPTRSAKRTSPRREAPLLPLPSPPSPSSPSRRERDVGVSNFYTSRKPGMVVNMYEDAAAPSEAASASSSSSAESSLVTVSPLKQHEMGHEAWPLTGGKDRDTDRSSPAPWASEAAPPPSPPLLRLATRHQAAVAAQAPTDAPTQGGQRASHAGRTAQLGGASEAALAQLEEQFNEKYSRYLRPSPERSTQAPPIKRILQPTAASKAQERGKKTAPSASRSRSSPAIARSDGLSPSPPSHHPSWSPPAEARRPLPTQPPPAHVRESRRLRSRVARYAQEVRQRNARAISEEQQERQERRVVSAAKRAMEEQRAETPKGSEAHPPMKVTLPPSPSSPANRPAPASAPLSEPPRVQVSLAELCMGTDDKADEPSSRPAPASQEDDPAVCPRRPAASGRPTMMMRRQRAQTQPPPPSPSLPETQHENVSKREPATPTLLPPPSSSPPPPSGDEARPSPPPQPVYQLRSPQANTAALAPPHHHNERAQEADGATPGKEGDPPNEVLLKLKGKCTALLTACTRLDRSRTGYLSCAEFAKALNASAPALTDKDTESLLRWAVGSTGERKGSSGIPYARLVGNLIASEAISLSPSPKKGLPPPTPSSASAAAAPAEGEEHRPMPLARRAHQSQLEELRRRAREGREQLRHLLHAELSQLTGGDTDALCDFFFAHYDDSRTGYLEEPKLREALTRVFQENAQQPIPPWLLEQCILIARTPFTHEAAIAQTSAAATSSSGEKEKVGSAPAAPPAETRAEAEARARVHRLPRLLWQVMCDYRYLFEELDL